MRASNLVIVFLTVLTAAGCQSVPYQTAPIVGDSMTIGGAGYPESYGPMVGEAGLYAGPPMTDFQGCPPGGCPAGDFEGYPNAGCTGGSCTSPYDCPCADCASGLEPQHPIGCAGGFCDGRCHGLCRLAHAQHMAMLRQKHQQFQQFIASRPIQTHIHNAATRHCEGAVGPQFGAVHYPYYTTRGPRDFLLANPASIGP